MTMHELRRALAQSTAIGCAVLAIVFMIAIVTLH